MVHVAGLTPSDTLPDHGLKLTCSTGKYRQFGVQDELIWQIGRVNPSYMKPPFWGPG